MILRLAILTIVGGIIGWVTNVLAIKMLFRPIRPITIPLTNIKIQGLIPKRRNEIAKSIGEAIEDELVKLDEIIEKLATSDNKSEVIHSIKRRVIQAVDLKIPSIIPSAIKLKLLEYIGDQIDVEAEGILDRTVDDLKKKAMDKIKIGEIVAEKIDEFELEKIEEMILKIASTELKHIEVLGGVLGAVIGFFQGLLVLLI